MVHTLLPLRAGVNREFFHSSACACCCASALCSAIHPGAPARYWQHDAPAHLPATQPAAHTHRAQSEPVPEITLSTIQCPAHRALPRVRLATQPPVVVHLGQIRAPRPTTARRAPAHNFAPPPLHRRLDPADRRPWMPPDRRRRRRALPFAPYKLAGFAGSRPRRPHPWRAARGVCRPFAGDSYEFQPDCRLYRL
jgi:hypothetical protein